ncbi:coagulation factor 5/8 type domain protein [Catenulispora acidiphila DSM 44928]|uniref:Coagulation factor 5/8 type domain protein n=1 Tax=Catenulispora acidiphila (strain DSM 44928 / JCM 14897 / NBRC 102108 / NRRL B-24433 / ID139908) TaxID=479433 RepID=C7Q002_CATAD|nr:discoidin domain-containing protein [Catenulispora acidiphila]ACU75495.1 coagulation factor 5/8 type domain protein [Catenulispora acidiphila DSM 44928]
MGTALHRWRRTVLAIVAAVAPIAATVAVAFPPSASAAVPAAVPAVAPAAIPSAVPAPPSGWTTAFSDDFTGAANTPIDSNWIYDLGTSYPGGAGNWGTGEVESETNSTQNVYQDGAGHLVIKPIRDAQGAWTSGRVETARTDFAAPAGGQMEITASLQQPNPANGLGYWPAFWAMGANARPVGATNWPSIGELDIMEDVNALSEVSHTFHCGVDPGGPCNETTGISSGLLACGGCQTAFHTYSVIIDRTNANAEQLRFYTDNVLQHTVNQNQVDANTWATAVDHGFFAILNVAIGGVYPFNVCQCTEPTAATTSGAPMTVDYVAVYTTQQGGGQSVATPTFNPAGGTYASAQSVTLSDTTPGSSIRYTLDGSTPTASSTLYTGPITIAATTTVKAIGLASGLTNSATASATYTIGGSNSPDYTQSATQLNATQAQLSITPTTPAAYVDVHYLVNGGGQQNFRMTNNAGTWTQTVSSLTTGAVVEYWFTYEKNGAQYDTPHFTYTQGGGSTGGTLLSQGHPATASSVENATYPASNAVDGNTTTRWSSAFSDPQWLQVDLGATHSISRVTLNWEAAYATAFQIQTSTNGTTWTPIYSTTTGTGGVQTLTVSGSGRYVRMYGTSRATPYGYSLYEFQVMGS